MSTKRGVFMEKTIIVIIPVYNCKKYISQTVSSVLEQPYTSIQVVIIDDGSTDGTSDLCDKMAMDFENVTVLHQSNAGVSKARNTGIEYAMKISANLEDSYVAFLDGDDLWVRNAISEDVNEILMQGYDLIGFQSCLVNDNLTRCQEPIDIQTGAFIGDGIKNWTAGIQHFGAMLYSLKFLSFFDIRFFDIHSDEDMIFVYHCKYLARSCIIVNKVIYLYRMRTGSLIHTKKMGVSHFIPVIDAFLELDVAIRIWKKSDRSSASYGKIMAQNYILRMIDEEFQCSLSHKKLDDLFLNRRDLYEMMEYDIASEHLRKQWNEIKSYPWTLRINRRAFGISRFILKGMNHFSITRVIADAIKFPLKLDRTMIVNFELK